MPASAVRIRLCPSNSKGFVTTATVSTPSSFAVRAMIGAAPVPVPPTHASGNEKEMDAVKIGADFFQRFLSRGRANFGPRPRAKTLGDVRTHLDDGPCARRGKGLCVRIRSDELDAFEAALNHVVNGVAARAADANDRDARPQLRQPWKLQVYSHDKASSAFFTGFEPAYACSRLRGADIKESLSAAIG